MMSALRYSLTSRGEPADAGKIAKAENLGLSASAPPAKSDAWNNAEIPLVCVVVGGSKIGTKHRFIS
jgi:hypothetical protein